MMGKASQKKPGRKEERNGEFSLSSVFFQNKDYMTHRISSEDHLLRADQDADEYRSEKRTVMRMLRQPNSLEKPSLYTNLLHLFVDYPSLFAEDFRNTYSLLGSSKVFWWWLAQYVAWQPNCDFNFLDTLLKDDKYKQVTCDERIQGISDLDKMTCDIRIDDASLGSFFQENDYDSDESSACLPLSCDELLDNHSDSLTAFQNIMLAQDDPIIVYQGFVTIDAEQLRSTLHTSRSHEKSVLRRSKHWCFTLDPHIAEHFAFAFSASVLDWALSRDKQFAAAMSSRKRQCTSSRITVAKAFMGRPTVGKFQLAKSDVIAASNARGEQEVIVSPKNARLIGYQFIAPPYSNISNYQIEILNTWSAGAQVYAARRLEDWLARSKKYKKRTNLHKITKSMWIPRMRSKFATKTNTKILQLLLDNPAMHRRAK